MPNKERLLQLVDSLSDYECSHLLSIVDRTAAGNRFWETDMANLYNEFVKLRQSQISHSGLTMAPPVPQVEEGIFAPIPIAKSYPQAARIALPPHGRLAANFSEVILNRRSERDYTGAAMPLADLSTLLHHGCGITGFVAAYGYTRLPLRTFPSSGGLQSPEVYLSIQAVEGVSAGLYHYNQMDHALELLTPGSHGSMLRQLSLDQPWLETASLVFVITGYYERLRWKYQERGYRFMCMDAGFLGENVYLTAQAMSFGACAIAGFVDDAIEALFGIDGEDEMPLMLISVGTLKKS